MVFLPVFGGKLGAFGGMDGHFWAGGMWRSILGLLGPEEGEGIHFGPGGIMGAYLGMGDHLGQEVNFRPGKCLMLRKSTRKLWCNSLIPTILRKIVTIDLSVKIFWSCIGTR